MMYEILFFLAVTVALGLVFLAVHRTSQGRSLMLQKAVDVSNAAIFLFNPIKDSLTSLKKSDFHFLGYKEIPTAISEQIKSEGTALMSSWEDGTEGSKTIEMLNHDNKPVKVKLTVSAFSPELEKSGCLVTLNEIQGTTAKEVAQTENEKLQLIQMERYTVLKDLGAGVAHEINNPLAVILGRTQTMKVRVVRGTATPQDFLETLEKIETNVKRISKIITAMRLMTKDSSSEKTENLPVVAILEDIQSVWQERLHNRGYDFQIHRPDSGFCIMGRRSLLITALFNMISNSFEATQTVDEKWIRIETKVEGNFIEIAMVDSGKGIPPESRTRIFDPFFTTHDAAKAAGLGLSVAKGIFELHKGTITYDDQSPNTRFVIRLPLNENIQQKAA